MPALKIVTSLNKEKDAPETTVDYMVPDTLAECATRFGEAIVLSIFKRQLVISAQSHIRGLMNKNKRQAEIQTSMATWKPGMAVVRKDPIAAISKKFSDMTEEQKAELLKVLTAAPAAKAGQPQVKAAHK